MEVVRQRVISASGCSLYLYLFFRKVSEENPLSQRYVVAKGKRLIIAFAANCGKSFWQEIQNWVSGLVSYMFLNVLSVDSSMS